MAERATPEGEGSSARDSKLPRNGGKGSMKASARPAASYEETQKRSIVALQKLGLEHDQEIRELAGALTDFWLAPKSLQAVKEGMEAGADCMKEAKKRGRGHGLGARYTHVAAAFVEALAIEADTQTSADDIHGACGSEAGNGDRVLWSVQGLKDACSADETLAALRKAKVTMTFNTF